MHLETCPQVRELCEVCNPRQCFFFVCDSRKPTATAVSAHISGFDARKEARRIGGIVRVGWYDRTYKRAVTTDETPPWEQPAMCGACGGTLDGCDARGCK